MVNKINNSTISTLLRGQIYAPEQATQVREAAPVQAPKQQYTESKENLDEELIRWKMARTINDCDKCRGCPEYYKES